jgi:hypothetical protein
MTRGVLFISVGDRSIRESCRCALTIRRHAPGLKTAIQYYNDVHDDFSIFDFASRLVLPRKPVIPKDKDLAHKNNTPKYLGMMQKSRMVQLSPFDQTLFLDSDTFVVSDRFLELFDYDCDLTAKLHPIPTMDNKIRKRPALAKVKGIVMGMVHYSSGTVMFNKNDRVEELGRRWASLWQDCRHVMAEDEMSFCAALHEMRGRINIKPCSPIFNLPSYELKKHEHDGVIFHYQRSYRDFIKYRR